MNQKPNIIYIISDEHRGQAMSHLGDPNVHTPAMDYMAREGVSFERAYANCPICTPSRGSIFSGRYPHAGPVSGFFDVYKATAPSTATILRNEGYHTAYFGKWHMGIVHDQTPPAVRKNPEAYAGSPQRTPEYHRGGFQDWYGFENLNSHFESYYYKNKEINPTRAIGYETDAYTNLALDYMNTYQSEKPLFLVLSVTPPHFPLIVPDRWKRFNPSELTTRPNFEDTPSMRDGLAHYYAMIENLDWNIGRLLDGMKRLPKFADTLVVYISDHGEYMGSHNMIIRKEHPHEESVRIPAIFYWPDQIKAQGKKQGLFSIVDLLATTLGLINVKLPSYNQGTDFSPAIRNEPFTGPESVLIEMTNNPRWDLTCLDWRGFLTNKWKYAYYETGAELLYDMDEDPYELNNLAYTDSDLRDAMRAKLLELLKVSREPYFDVLIQYGVASESAVIDVSGS